MSHQNDDIFVRIERWRVLSSIFPFRRGEIRGLTRHPAMELMKITPTSKSPFVRLVMTVPMSNPI